MWANILSGSLLTKVLLENKGRAILFLQWKVKLKRHTHWLQCISCPSQLEGSNGVRYAFQQLQHYTDLISYSAITKYISDLRYLKGTLHPKHLVI